MRFRTSFISAQRWVLAWFDWGPPFAGRSVIVYCDAFVNLSFTAIHPAMHHTNIPGQLGGNWNDPGETWTSNNFKKTTSKVSGFLHHPIISNHIQSMNQRFPHRMHGLSFLHFLPCEQLGDFNGWQKDVSEPQQKASASERGESNYVCYVCWVSNWF